MERQDKAWCEYYLSSETKIRMIFEISRLP
jgi:hypothetical protein